MPYGKGTYGSKVGRPKKKKTNEEVEIDEGQKCWKGYEKKRHKENVR